jgi:hypothetical protein
MNNPYAYHNQKDLPLITKEEIDAFNTERFQFAKDAPGKAVGVSPMEALREASVKLMESAFGASKTEPPVITDTVLERYTGTQDESVW